jgi:hypothetical protein
MIKNNFSLFFFYLQLTSLVILISSLLTSKYYINNQSQMKRAHLRLESLTHYAHFLLLETSSVETQSFSFSKSKTLYTFYWSEYSNIPYLTK